MNLSEALEPARQALTDGEAALRVLDAGCCEPGRSPSIAALARALAEVREGVERVADDPRAVEATVALAEDAGAQVGRLQVGCCTEKRLPLYTRILGDLATVQLTVNRAVDRGH